MQYRTYAPPRRWCPNCESKGIPIVWGYPPADLEPFIATGQMVVGGCEVGHDPATHLCETCGACFSGTDRRYVVERGDRIAHGIGVWPHARRSVRIEVGDGATMVILVEGVGSLLIPGEGLGIVVGLAWAGMGPAELERWASARGRNLDMRIHSRSRVEVRLGAADLDLILLAAKQWWRTLGRDQFADAVVDLETHGVNPVIHRT